MKHLFISACLLAAPLGASAQLLVEPVANPECIKFFDKGARKISNQGMAINGNYMYNFLDGGTCQVFDITKKDSIPVGVFTLESAQKDNHCNQVNFGNVTLKGAIAPLAYITVGKVGADIEFKCFVESFSKKGKKFSSELVQTITLDTTGFHKNNILSIFGCPSWLVDKKRNEIWALSALKRTKLKTTGEPYNNKYVLLKFDLPSLSDGKEITLKAKDVKAQRIFDFDAYATQGGCADDGKIYYSFGFGKARNYESPSKVRVFDTDRRVISARYDLKDEIPEECECVAVPGDGYMYINTNSNYVYRIPMPEEPKLDVFEDPSTLLRKFPEMIGGTYWISPFNTPEEKAAPAGYEPFYIGAYGRHGMRYLDNAGTVPMIAGALRMADSLNILTPFGKAIKGRFDMIYNSINNRTGELTKLGMEQWRNHAARIAREYPEVFKGKPYLHEESTSVMRTALSLTNFDHKLREFYPNLPENMDVSVRFHDWLNPYANGNKYKTDWDESFRNNSGAWYPAWREFALSKVDPQLFMARIFTDPKAIETKYDALEIQNAFFLLANDAMALDMPMLFSDMFTPEELIEWWEIDNLKYYQQKGPWTQAKGRPWRHGALILKEMLETSRDHLENNGSNGLCMRLGHDGCIMAMLAVMEADQWGVETDDSSKAKDYWKSYHIPMATFCNFNFYRNPSDPDADILVKVILNGNACKLPLPEVSDKCYRWKDFDSYYSKRIEKDIQYLVDTMDLKP